MGRLRATVPEIKCLAEHLRGGTYCGSGSWDTAHCGEARAEEGRLVPLHSVMEGGTGA